MEKNDDYASIKKRNSGNNCTNVEEVAQQYVEDYDNMVQSVCEYKGFYIGRYELTEVGEKQGTPFTNKTWFESYNECMDFSKENTESGMIYGTLWDATMAFKI